MQIIEAKLLASEVKCKHYGNEKLYGHSTQERKVKTTVGSICLTLARVRCQSCKKSFCPLNQLLDLDRYSRKSRELETINHSFRRCLASCHPSIKLLQEHSWKDNNLFLEIIQTTDNLMCTFIL